MMAKANLMDERTNCNVDESLDGSNRGLDSAANLMEASYDAAHRGDQDGKR